MNEFKRCIKERKLLKINATKDMIKKEISSAKYDLERARSNLKEEDFKWSAVQSY